MRETDYQLEELEPRILLSADWNGVFEAEALDESVWEPAALEIEALDDDGGAGESVSYRPSGSSTASELGSLLEPGAPTTEGQGVGEEQ